MIAATWLWVLVGVAFVFVAGLLLFLALGLTALPGDFLRRVAQAGTAGRSERGATCRRRCLRRAPRRLPG